MKKKRRLSDKARWIILILTIILAFYLYFSGLLQNLINSLGQFQIIGVLIAGMLFVFAFTAAPATASLIGFTNTINPILISFIGAVGVMIGALLVFNFFKKDLPDEIEEIINKTKLNKLRKIKIKWLIPLIVGFIIATPIPDEIAIALLAENKFDANAFMLFAFIFAFIGLLIITTIARLI